MAQAFDAVALILPIRSRPDPEFRRFDANAI
jgi:hypothetical protein